MSETPTPIPDDLRACVAFHGHLCPGLVYGFLIAREAKRRLGLNRADDEEVVAICENDTCAVDALQVLLGTTLGKGNLRLNNYGKSVFLILDRKTKRALRFSRKAQPGTPGPDTAEFLALDRALSLGSLDHEGRRKHKLLKVQHLLKQNFEDIFTIAEVDYFEPPLAVVARSEPCARCGELTMSGRLVPGNGGRRLCLPCAQTEIKSPLEK